MCCSPVPGIKISDAAVLHSGVCEYDTKTLLIASSYTQPLLPIILLIPQQEGSRIPFVYLSVCFCLSIPLQWVNTPRVWRRHWRPTPPSAYTSPEVAHAKAGENLSIPQATPTPTFAVAASALKSEPGTKYVVVSIDLDAPFPSWSFLGPILHGLHFDLVAGDPGADGFVPLEGGSEWVVPWLPPGPPKPSSAHRYVFQVFEQPRTWMLLRSTSALNLPRR